jgi:hypothetical protein
MKCRIFKLCLTHRKNSSPSAAVEIGDFFRGRRKVVGQDAQDAAGLDLDADLANPLLHRVAAPVGLPRRQIAGAIRQDRGAGRGLRTWLDQAFGFQCQRRIGLEAGDNSAARGIEFCPPGVVISASRWPRSAQP